MAITRSAPHMVLAVMLSSQAPIATIRTATSDCNIAETKESTMPRFAVSWLATRQDEITALPWPGPAAWKLPEANEIANRPQTALPSDLAARMVEDISR